MSDDENTEPEAGASVPELAGEPAPIVKTKRHSRRSRLISGGFVLVGVLAIVFAVVQAQADGYHTPKDEGYVPLAATTPAAPSSTAIEPSSAPSPSKSKPKAKPSATKTEKPAPTKSKTPPRPVMPPAEMQLQVSSIGVDAPVVPATVSHGALNIPEDPRYVGLWTGGARPGGARARSSSPVTSIPWSGARARSSPSIKFRWVRS